MRLVHLPREDGYGTIERTENRLALAATMATLPAALCGSITWDRAKELSAHVAFTDETGIPVFFTDPKSPCQRNTNENANGLLWHWFPKGTDLSRWDAEELQAVEDTPSSRPCKILGWRTPTEALTDQLRSLEQVSVASTS